MYRYNEQRNRAPRRVRSGLFWGVSAVAVLIVVLGRFLQAPSQCPTGPRPLLGIALIGGGVLAAVGMFSIWGRLDEDGSWGAAHFVWQDSLFALGAVGALVFASIAGIGARTGANTLYWTQQVDVRQEIEPRVYTEGQDGLIRYTLTNPTACTVTCGKVVATFPKQFFAGFTPRYPTTPANTGLSDASKLAQILASRSEMQFPELTLRPNQHFTYEIPIHANQFGDYSGRYGIECGGDPKWEYDASVTVERK